MPRFSDYEEDDEETEEFDFEMTLGSTLRSMRHTSATHRQGRVIVSSDDDNDDGGDGRAAQGGDGVDWENIKEEDDD